LVRYTQYQIKMYFKPRIFLSSVLSLINVRDKIANLLEANGADVMRYETNLTPSTIPATYRYDILEADFIIFILDSNYGTLTNSGKSGTHEEWDIALTSEIPKHVYIKQISNSENKLQEFIKKEINDNFISYFYYKNDAELLNQVKAKSFVMAREIVIQKLDENHLTTKQIKDIAFKHDYHRLLQIIKSIEEVFEFNKNMNLDFLSTTILSNLMDFWKYQSKNNQYFVQEENNLNLENLLKYFYQFRNLHSKFFTSVGDLEQTELKSLKIPISYRELKKHENVDIKKINNLLKKFLIEYSYFKSRVFEAKQDYDIRY
ncbi:DUF4062 domain-containing protein, partial [Leptospira sp. 85282-16]|uniref:DUF4062 domain-containing protein n=1 Tax=Leptospira sp. 85282-16 TaxID=2971256 RepID=UPI0021C0812F